MAKPNPSYKSKRYRDKLRHEIRDLEDILPIDRTVLHRKLDSQTVFRMSIAFFRSKLFLQDIIQSSLQSSLYTSQRLFMDHPYDAMKQNHIEDIDVDQERLLQALDGFLLILSTDGTMLYISNNILHHLGFNQIDLVMRCIYSIIHPDDHQELKTILEDTLMSDMLNEGGQECCPLVRGYRICRRVSFLCRMKCFSGATTGYLKMHCAGHLRHFPSVMRSQRTTNQLLFAFCRPFVSIATESATDVRRSGFWTKHDLDLKFKQMDPAIPDTLGYEVKYLEGQSLYRFVHPEDLYVFKSCHKTLITTEEIHTIYFRIQHLDGTWIWVHTRGKVVFKNSKKYSIVFTHCPVREEDSTYIQQEVVLRHRNAINDLMYPPLTGSNSLPHHYNSYNLNQTMDRCPLYSDTADLCPSSWHTTADRHSPVFPNNLHGQALYYKKETRPLGRPSTLASRQQDTYYCTQQQQNLVGFKQLNRNFHTKPSTMESIPQFYKEYHLEFNSIGISRQEQQQHYNELNQSDFSTMHIQGHVTAIETNTGNTTCNNDNILYGHTGLSYNRMSSDSNMSPCKRLTTSSCRYETVETNPSSSVKLASDFSLLVEDTNQTSSYNNSNVKRQESKHSDDVFSFKPSLPGSDYMDDVSDMYMAEYCGDWHQTLHPTIDNLNGSPLHIDQTQM